jgi:hypothetical protein
MDTVNDIREVRNTSCGKNKCNKQATIRIIFALGFSANFCTECAEELIQEGAGTEKQHLNKEIKALESVGRPAANAIHNLQSNSKECVQRK